MDHFPCAQEVRKRTRSPEQVGPLTRGLFPLAQPLLRDKEQIQSRLLQEVIRDKYVLHLPALVVMVPSLVLTFPLLHLPLPLIQ